MQFVPRGGTFFKGSFLFHFPLLSGRPRTGSTTAVSFFKVDYYKVEARSVNVMNTHTQREREIEDMEEVIGIRHFGDHFNLLHSIFYSCDE